MIHERDERGTETTAERTERLARERYAAARVQFKESGGWTRWKGLTGAQRLFAGGGIAFVVIVIVMVVVYAVN